MLEKLKLYIDLNEIEDTEKYIEIGKYIVQNSSKQVLNFTKKGCIFEYFKEMINQKITAEDFVQIGDVDSICKLNYQGNSFEAFEKVYTDVIVLDKDYSNSVLIFDQSGKINFEEKNKKKLEELEETFSKNNSMMFFL